MIHTISVLRSNHPHEPSQVIIGNALTRLDALLDGKRPVVITDQNLLDAYPHLIGRWPHVVIGLGEERKTLRTVEEVCRQLIALGVDRGSYLLGIGGGIVTDVAGFVASVYMRGVAGFGFVATSLLAQVDASVGGKNGVNLDGYKNMVGVFNQPDFVLCDQGMLSTLPERELKAGLAEVIKCGLIGDAELFGWFENERSYAGFIAQDELVHRSVVRAVELKAAVVAEDETERGNRKLLNLGHTFAHAVEKTTEGKYLHGEAVAIGMCVAAGISHRLGLLTTDQKARVIRVIGAMELPTELPEGISVEELMRAIASDKKQEAGSIDFVLMDGIGRAVRRKMPLEELAALV